ncbi:hypothetical protein [Haloarcula marina]|uniref:hypothetical protein n=1 Tax=Haloarcula marina TaxID=2961574 RepID=UPI0020B8B334|nr:hypothetical protein [Halomicroarcula marina]
MTTGWVRCVESNRKQTGIINKHRTAFASPDRYLDASEQVNDFNNINEWDVKNGSLYV